MQLTENILTVLGDHISLILIGCAEFLAALFIFSSFVFRRMKKTANYRAKEYENSFLGACTQTQDETILLIRKEDKLPVYATGKPENIIGVSLQSLQDDITIIREQLKDPKDANKFMNACAVWDQTTPISSYFLLKDGRWVLAMLQQSSSNNYLLLTFREATQTCQRFENYEKQLAKSEEESMSKTTFLYRMSHEIRTPMNGIMGMLTLSKDTLQKNPDPDQQNQVAQYLDKAGELSEHLLSLINDILDMSRIEAGKVELENKRFSLCMLGKRLYDMFAGTIEEKGVSYHVYFEDMTADWVLGDELRISQILINFLSNAIKFTKEGEISLTFRQMMRREGTVDMMFCVHDTGIGMKPEFVNRIFRPFEQENAGIARNYGGTGLGMAITDNLVKLMQGEIVVKSTPDVGSDFTIFLSLPIAEAPEEILPSELQVSASAITKDENCFIGKHILLAEDNEVNAMIAVEILKQMGAQIDIAEDGSIALEKFRQSTEYYYDLILMDVQMPVMNGRDAARAIRKLDRKDAGSVLIFALSADAFVEDERASIESGMNGHFAKPVDFNALERNISRFLTKKD